MQFRERAFYLSEIQTALNYTYIYPDWVVFEVDNLEPFLIDGDAPELSLINCPLSVLVFSALALIR